MTRILDANGQAFPLGRELGRGGEGAVFEVTGQPNRVAKLYHEPPDPRKQEKLRLMAAGVDDRLRRYAAWPEATLHREADQAVAGFVMQRIEQRVPIHMLYHPAQRRKQFPKVRFDFLVFVARNIAAAFDTLHDHGHVLGDVNQGNVLVGEDSQVMLIDCDSFQVRFGDALHRCEVGVAHFTPPELQRVQTFEHTTRTPNHDCFGLALLIFHLLMGGRHPFSGVPQSERVGQALEADIRDHRYAYASDAKQRLLLPPPRSVPITILPVTLRAMFEQAFLEAGTRQRPSAEQWVQALDQWRPQLKTCSRQSLHVYPGHLASCSWCALERERVVLFGVPQTAAPAVPSVAPILNLSAIRQSLNQLKLPELVTVPQSPTLPMRPAQVSPMWRYWGVPGIAGGLFFLLAMLQMPEGRTMLMAVSITLFLLAAAVKYATDVALSWQAELLERLVQTFHALSAELDVVVAEVNTRRGAERILAARTELEDLMARYETLRREGLASIKRSLKDSEDIALQRHLQRTKLEQFPEQQTTTLVRAHLQNLGVHSAADLSAAKLGTLMTSHPELCQKMIDWRQALSVKFRQQYAQKAMTPHMMQRQFDTQVAALAAEVQQSWQRLQTIKISPATVTRADRARIDALIRRRLAIYQDYCRELLR